jgi:hypothetical protein
VYVWTDASGVRRRGTVDTLADAQERRDAEQRRARDGAPSETVGNRQTFGAYALELFGASLERAHDEKPAQGRYEGRRGAVRPSTVDSYRRHLETYWLPHLTRRPLGAITARTSSAFSRGSPRRTATGTYPTRRCGGCSRPCPR